MLSVSDVKKLLDCMNVNPTLYEIYHYIYNNLNVDIFNAAMRIRPSQEWFIKLDSPMLMEYCSIPGIKDFIINYCRNGGWVVNFDETGLNLTRR
jgi:hypothetical protein